MDNECWETLIDIANIAGEEALAAQFSEALAAEQRHLAKVREWLAAHRGG